MFLTTKREKSKMIKIEKNVPLPSKKGKHSEIVYAVSMMGVGESFYHSQKYKGGSFIAPSVASNVGAKENKKFVSRSEGIGVRIWRTA